LKKPKEQLMSDTESRINWKTIVATYIVGVSAIIGYGLPGNDSFPSSQFA
jgi:hypothetical protein